MCVPYEYLFENDWQVLCIAENGINIYGDGSTGCFEIISDSKQIPSRQQQIQISPNPASSTLLVELTNLHSNSFEINIYSATGKLIEKSSQQGEMFHLSVETLPPGIYWLEVRNDEQVGGKKFLKL